MLFQKTHTDSLRRLIVETSIKIKEKEKMFLDRFLRQTI